MGMNLLTTLQLEVRNVQDWKLVGNAMAWLSASETDVWTQSCGRRVYVILHGQLRSDSRGGWM